MDNVEEISSWIENHSKEVVESIEQESINVYNFLRREFEKSNVTENHLFQFVYRSFYRIDNAGLTTEFKKEYFKILEEYRHKENFDFHDVLTRLNLFHNLKGHKTLQFSFATKMLNMIDDSMPIYDSKVTKMFSFSRPYQSDFQIKLDKYLEQFEVIKNGYNQIAEQNLLSKTFKLIEQNFPDSNLSKMNTHDNFF